MARRLSILAVVVLAVQLSGCGSTSAPSAPSGPITVVAAENFWGSLVTQLGGSHVSVSSVLSDPNADPHEYESNSNDARAFADASYVIVNGAGYDTWAQKLLDANPASARVLVSVAALAGAGPGANPHFWYSPDVVTRVMDRITADLTTLDPADRAYFAQQHTAVVAAFGPYRALLAAIRTAYAGRPVAATETIFVYLAQALGLTLISPPAFMRAVAEGNDPPAQSVAQFGDQLRARQARVLVFNSQTVTPTTTSVRQLAVAAHIPTVAVTETMPSGGVFQEWQVAELRSLQAALAAAPAP